MRWKAGGSIGMVLFDQLRLRPVLARHDVAPKANPHLVDPAVAPYGDVVPVAGLGDLHLVWPEWWDRRRRPVGAVLPLVADGRPVPDRRSRLSAGRQRG